MIRRRKRGREGRERKEEGLIERGKKKGKGVMGKREGGKEKERGEADGEEEGREERRDGEEWVDNWRSRPSRFLARPAFPAFVEGRRVESACGPRLPVSFAAAAAVAAVTALVRSVPPPGSCLALSGFLLIWRSARWAEPVAAHRPKDFSLLPLMRARRRLG